MEMAGIRGSLAVENTKNPSQYGAHVSRMARIVVAWLASIEYTIHMILGVFSDGDNGVA
jgi:hypothetical protein